MSHNCLPCVNPESTRDVAVQHQIETVALGGKEQWTNLEVQTSAENWRTEEEAQQQEQRLPVAASTSPPRPPPKAQCVSSASLLPPGPNPPPAMSSHLVHKQIRGVSFPITGKMAMASICLHQCKQPRFLSMDINNKPQGLQDSLSCYIDYLLQENEIKTSMSLVKFTPMPCEFERERYFYEAIQNSVPFPTPKFRDWIKTYGMDIEVGVASASVSASDTHQLQQMPLNEPHWNNASPKQATTIRSTPALIQQRHKPYDHKAQARCVTIKEGGARERMGLPPSSPTITQLLNQLSDVPVLPNPMLGHDYFLASLKQNGENVKENCEAQNNNINLNASPFQLQSPSCRRTFNLINSPHRGTLSVKLETITKINEVSD